MSRLRVFQRWHDLDAEGGLGPYSAVEGLETPNSSVLLDRLWRLCGGGTYAAMALGYIEASIDGLEPTEPPVEGLELPRILDPELSLEYPGP